MLIVFFLPSFFFSQYKDRTVSNQLALVELTDQKAALNPTTLIQQINKMIAVLSSGENGSISTSDLIQKIVSIKKSGITISRISVSQIDALSESISVGGTAMTRDGLTAFYNDLKNDPIFESATLPVSSLIQDTNADFTIGLVYKAEPSQ